MTLVLCILYTRKDLRNKSMAIDCKKFFDELLVFILMKNKKI